MNELETIGAIEKLMDERFGKTSLLRDRAMCLAMEAFETVSVAVEDDPDAMIDTLLRASDKVYAYLKKE